MLLITTVVRWVTGGGDQTNILILILLTMLVREERLEDI